MSRQTAQRLLRIRCGVFGASTGAAAALRLAAAEPGRIAALAAAWFAGHPAPHPD